MYKLTTDEITKQLGSNKSIGLTAEQVSNSQQKYGINELQAQKRNSLFLKFLSQFKDVLVIILLSAGIISIIVEPTEWVDSVIIFAVVMLNALLGVFQENKAEKSLDALKKMSSPKCKVVRDGIIVEIDTIEVVVGDIICIEAGDFIPADARIIECSNLMVDESALTGESLAVNKTSEVISGYNIPLGDRKNLVFSSTFVTNGRATAIVTHTGMQTEIGKIASMLMENGGTQTPLQQKLNQVGKVVGMLAIAICVVVFVLEWISIPEYGALESFKSAVALAVAAIPEGLSAVVTIILAMGVQKMVKKNAIIKKLPAVETLGSTTIVCSDKTGTLTQNKMTVVKFFNQTLKNINDTNDSDKQMLEYFAICCSAEIQNVNGEEKRIGDPTELALIEANNKYGWKNNDWKKVADIPFDSERKMMTVVCKNSKGKYLSITKGAPDIIIKKSIPTNHANSATKFNEEMGREALRVLGIGIRQFDSMPQVDSSLEENLAFVGLVGMIDPPRPEVKLAIEQAKKAGIRTIMITGDHINTASAIARELGILNNGQKAITGEFLQDMTDEELIENISNYSVYARVSPKDKVRIVETWQKLGNVVAMTGDGVNDSPALKKADIGCAMGITGTDVAKESADMILADDNFATIISAVHQGRGIFANIQKCVKYLLSSNIGEVLTIFVASLLASFGFKQIGIPLEPIHLLWINLITDSLPAFGLGIEEAEAEIMTIPPRQKSQGFFANGLGTKIILEGICIGAITLGSYLIGTFVFNNHVIAQTMAFVTLSSTQLFHSYNIRNEKSVFNKDILSNKFLNLAFVIGFGLQMAVVYIPGVNDIFKVTALGLDSLIISLLFGLGIVVIMEIAKLVRRLKKANKIKIAK